MNKDNPMWDRLSTTARFLEKSDARIKASKTAVRLMDIISSIDNPTVRAGVLLAHHRRNPNSKLDQYPVYSKAEAMKTFRSYTKHGVTSDIKRQLTRLNVRIQNVEKGVEI